MRYLRHKVALVGLSLFGLAILWAGHGAGQPGFPTQPGVTPPTPNKESNAANLSSVKIVEDAAFRKAINVGRDCIKDKDWNQAVKALQAVLKDDQDHYVQVRETDATGKISLSRWTSVKFEANNLIGSMPLEGLQTYEVAFGGEAKAKLDEAKAKGDRELLAEVAQRYCHTRAGIEANEIMATLFLARGQVFTAALRFERLLQMNPNYAKIGDLTLYKAALAFRRTGDKQNGDETWDRLKNNLQGKPGLKIGDDMIPVATLEKVLAENAAIDVVNVHDWPSWRGSNTNTAQAIGSPPLLDAPLFRRPIFKDTLDGFTDEDPDQAAQQYVQKALDQVNTANQAAMPGFFPIASQGIMIYRSHRDIRAVALKPLTVRDARTGAVSDVKPGQILWKSLHLERSLAYLLEQNRYRNKAEQWLTEYNRVPGFNSLLFENTVLGTLMTDHRNVYAIDDLAVPPHPNVFTQIGFQQPQFSAQELKPLLMQNQLRAFDLLTGCLVWELNGSTGRDNQEEDPDFKHSHFISLPIAIGGKLYVLNERLINPNDNTPNRIGGMVNPISGESELRIVCIDPTKVVDGKPAIVKPIQVLGNVSQHERFVQDIRRRVSGIQLAFGEGVLVCPTNAGEMFGIDVMTRSLVWSYPYRETEPQPIMLPGQFNPNPFPRPKQPRNTGTTVISTWKSSPPAIADGKVVFTAPDADSIHCINLRDGKPVWMKGQQKGDLFMAGVYNGRVIIVGENGIRAIDLKDGGQRWSAPTSDLPSGQGLASKGIYYQPLKRGEIIAVDIATGQIKAHNRAAPGSAAPGNLVFYEGMVLSQTINEVIAYPQLSVRLDLAKAELNKDPDNLLKTTDYGELLLKDGQVQPAVDNLMKVYNQNPADPLGKRAKDRLFEALTDLMHQDFADASDKYLTVYKVLCSVPGDLAEEQNRKSKFYRLVGQGREAQGKLVEAFQMYKDFGALPMHRDKGVPSSEDPNQLIPVNVWLRGRIAGMLAKATEAEKEPLEAKIAEEWKAVDAKKDLDAIRSFVGMFDTPFRVGREARIKLAETVLERNDRASLLEAELSLYQVLGSDFRADPQTGGRALAALAQLEEKKGTFDSMRLAAAYYRQMASEFPNVAIRGKKTGAELRNELATDKRFLPFLEETSNSWGPVKIAARDLPPNSFTIGAPGFLMAPVGDETPFAKQHRLLLDPSNAISPRLRLRDITTNQDRWEAQLGHVPMNQQVFAQLYQQSNPNQPYSPNARFRFYHVKGHLIVCQVGVMVYCLDGDKGTKLWEMQTVENLANNGQFQLQSVSTTADGNPEFHYRNVLTNQLFRVPLGRVGEATASYVAVLGHKGLIVVDPLRGTTMWKKPDISVNSHVFGDEQYLFLAEANENGAIGAGRVLRANDGEPVAIPDFSNVYQTRIRVLGRQILAAQSDRQKLTVRLYDILGAKDVWSKQFPPDSFVLTTEDRGITGVLDSKGNLTVLEATTGNALLASNIVKHRITVEAIKKLREPLLLQDAERFYLALNKPIDDGRVQGGLIYNNFNTGVRCLPVNGWFLAVHRQDGKRTVGKRELTWKKGDLAWHTYEPMLNQMIVLEQFEDSPIVLFTARYNESLPNGGNRWVSITQSVDKTSGKWVHEHRPANFNGFSPMFSLFQIDARARTVNLIGFSESVQHYVDDGKGPPPNQGAMRKPGGGIRDGTTNALLPVNPALLPPNGFLPPNAVAPPNLRLPVIRRNIQVAPPVQLPPIPKR